MKDIYKLTSRGLHNYYLEKVKNNHYALRGIDSYYRIGHDTDGAVMWVDPDDGPMLGIGSEIEEDIKISSIYIDQSEKCYVFVLNKD